METTLLLFLRLFEFEIHKEIDQYELDLVDSEEAARTRLYTMAEAEVFLAGCGGHVLAALSDQLLRDTFPVIPESIQFFRVAKSFRIQSNWPQRESNLGSYRDMCPVVERERYASLALGDNCELSV
jgi:hypothetical protein